MNHLKWVGLMAPIGLLALIIFLWTYQNHQTNFAIEQQRHMVQQLEFDRDFAKAWNGESIDVRAK